MKKMILSLGLGVIMLGTAGLAFANNSPHQMAEVYANLADMTTEEARLERQESMQPFGKLAKERGFYEQFKTEALQSKIAWIENKVSTGEITQSEADELISSLKNCDGTKSDTLKNAFQMGQQAKQMRRMGGRNQ